MIAEGGHRQRKPVHGDKAHVATDEDAVLIRGVEVTTANVRDAAELDAILPEAPEDAYGDNAYSGSKPEAAVRARGGTPRRAHAHLGWGGGARTAAGAQCRGTPYAVPDRAAIKQNIPIQDGSGHCAIR